MNRCKTCEYSDECSLANIINFCEDCKDYKNCTILDSEGCKKDYYIECNNGFEENDK